ncbi:proteinase-activated receptor 3 [Chanos chanos]|uniref:Proteinase-activated receptor 3 n=1 Tax=Chanos chanos TaxID=29144 RepID=A0A6J2UUP8_CHACN|nr:proteinase-activated receptor 3-like [Chanos chanos]
MWHQTVHNSLLHSPVERTSKKGGRKNSTTELADPRAFRGTREEVTPLFLPNSTQTELRSSVDNLKLHSNSTEEYLRGSLSTQVIPSLYITIIVTGIPPNVAILVFLVANLRMTSYAILYCSLALSDLFLLVSLIFKTHYHFNGNNWVFGEISCRLTTACFYGNLYCSMFTLTCISVKRYLAVVHPFLYKRLPKHAGSTWASLTVWVIFAMTMLPELLIDQSYKISNLDITTCHDVLPDSQQFTKLWISYNLGLTCIGFLLPLLVTVGCYASVIWHLNQSQLDWSAYIKASGIVFVIFLVCFMPSSCLHFLHYMGLYTTGQENFYAYFNLAVCLCCLHSSLDPFLFLLMPSSVSSKLYIMGHKGKNLILSL